MLRVSLLRFTSAAVVAGVDAAWGSRVLLLGLVAVAPCAVLLSRRWRDLGHDDAWGVYCGRDGCVVAAIASAFVLVRLSPPLTHEFVSSIRLSSQAETAGDHDFYETRYPIVVPDAC